MLDVSNESSVEVFGDHREESLSSCTQGIEVSTDRNTRPRRQNYVRCFWVHESEEIQ